MEEALADDPINSDSLLKMFFDPSTLPHLIFLAICSGFLFIAMKIDFMGSELQGGVLFLSLSMSYLFAAILAPSRLGKWAFMVNHDVRGVLNKNYWTRSFVGIVPIIFAAMTIWIISNSALGDDKLNQIKILLALLFVLMSAFQGLSLTFGWVSYGRKKQKTVRSSRSGGFHALSRSIVTLLVFAPLVWWFGYGAESPQNTKITENIAWIIFLIIITILCVALDRYSRVARELNDADGVILDRVHRLIFWTACWHLLGAWRRSPFTAYQSTSGMLLEEGALMSITIILAVWSISKRGRKNGWRVFQGQSAIFLGISFGFSYAGSISSLTALSEGSLLTTTAIGHVITAIVMLALLPVSISWASKNEIKEEVGSLIPKIVFNEPLGEVFHNNLDEEEQEEDLVELVN